jgi:hypothetical protein
MTILFFVAFSSENESYIVARTLSLRIMIQKRSIRQKCQDLEHAGMCIGACMDGSSSLCEKNGGDEMVGLFWRRLTILLFVWEQRFCCWFRPWFRRQRTELQINQNISIPFMQKHLEFLLLSHAENEEGYQENSSYVLISTSALHQYTYSLSFESVATHHS